MLRACCVVLLFAAVAHAQPAPDPTPPADPPAADPALDPTPADPPVAEPPPVPAATVEPPPVTVAAARKPEDVAALTATSGFKDGFILAAGDQSSKLYIGAISQFDGRFFVDNAGVPAVDQFVFNTLRLDLRGTVLDYYDFRILPDFASGKLVVQDAYVDVRYSELVKLRVGKTKVPFGLERLQNETSTTFVQRGLPTLLVPNRDLGAELIGDVGDGVIEWQAGIFNGVADGGSGDGDATNDKEGAARIFVRPLAHGPPLARKLGFGVAATYGDKGANLAQPDTPTWKTQGQSTIFTYVVGTTLANTVVADGLHWRATGQGYYYAGPFGVLAEYVRSVQHVVLNGTHERVSADAWQAVVQWVLTGDDATYNSVTPRHPFDPKRGTIGAFDVVARVGEIRLDGQVFDTLYADPTKSVRGAWSTGAGIDWFANKAFRAVLDVDRTWFALGAKTGDRPPETSIVARVQLAF